ncbi:MAG TPA: PQQ-binding-like beta-propeller repeat protein [Gemmatimonadales bacterium]
MSRVRPIVASRLRVAACCTAVVASSAGSPGRWPGPHADWSMFGWDVARSSAPGVSMGITAANVRSMHHQAVTIDGTVDASAIYLHAVPVHGAAHDVFFVTTTYGKTLAIDADDGAVLWEYTPPSYGRLAGSRQITTATPVADPDRGFIYTASPDGLVHKLAVADGSVEWSTAITRLPSREKIASALNFFRGRVMATTGGYIGDAPPYQGHVVLLDATTGRLEHVWNSLCSDRHELIDPSSCKESDSAIWGRAGAIVDSSNGDLFVATGNGRWDGRTNWGDAIIELDPDATRVVGNYTPTNTEQLDAEDGDLGSTAPALLGHGLIAQGGKDDLIRLLEWGTMRGSAPHKGGETQTVPTPSGDRLFTAPAVWHTGQATWLFAADNGATAARTVTSGRLRTEWHVAVGGTSPVIADGMLFAYDPGGGLHVYEATTGRPITTLECGGGHWNSPIVVDGRIALPEGNANAHRTTGVFDIWRLR